MGKGQEQPMNAIDLLAGPLAELPKSWPGGDYLQFVENIFADYINRLNGLTATDPFTASIINDKNACLVLSAHITTAIEHYLKGFPHLAYDEIKQAIHSIRPFFDKLLPPNDMTKELQLLYRIRSSQAFSLSREELFHIPFQLRHIVATQRYSIPGLPCLYLGGSLFVCWEELGRPPLDTLHMAKLSASGKMPVKVVNFGHRPELMAAFVHKSLSMATTPSPADVEYLTAQAICWPIIAACSIRVIHRDGTFKPEYIVPQLVLQWIRDEPDYHGLRYFSTHIDDYFNDPRAQLNYVFPVRTQQAHGICPELQKQFEMSSTVSWQAATMTPLPGGTTPYTNLEIELIVGHRQPYLTTQIGGMQAGIARLPTTPL
jgi:hypothetical protein